ncbi:MAG: hypothetical protein A2286_03410, partial [Gammaproteobacteria bacterium RIFOXYA12_FULL_61_12]
GCPLYWRLRFDFAIDSGAGLPEFPGSAWRGAFGRALRSLICVTRQTKCQGCLIAAHCPYCFLFETPVAQLPNGNTHANAPHPLVLELFPDAEQPGEPGHYAIGLTLIGQKAMGLLGPVVFALQQAGERGIAGDNHFRLQAVEQQDGAGWRLIHRPGGPLQPLTGQISAPALPSGPVSIDLTTPLRLTHHNRIAGERDLTPRIFIQALFRRFSQLSLIHGAGEPPPEPWPDIPADQPFAASDLHWLNLDRYSSRQGRKHQISGLMGSFTLDLTGLETAWPLLWHGQFLHLGKLTSLGHGGYRVGGGKLADTSAPQSGEYASQTTETKEPIP